MIIRTASIRDIEPILSLYHILFGEMAMLQPDRLKQAEQDRNDSQLTLAIRSLFGV
ncbi:acetyltransferase [Xenorhabdus beddingii]|uniref:Acetyltransferase n=1 Tax=Xenorhabdus beddingii TaxID=40578 RepID=A0A1Y2SR37_9GAMM|nr:hypothetical protein [Xenorhabdus beddingii]OTA21583.1 acetyltransferase [Xenorhabdus beddingii]